MRWEPPQSRGSRCTPEGRQGERPLPREPAVPEQQTLYHQGAWGQGEVADAVQAGLSCGLLLSTARGGQRQSFEMAGPYPPHPTARRGHWGSHRP